MRRTERPCIVAVGGDPGGARALLPLLQALQAETQWQCHFAAYRQALEIWRAAGLSVEILPDSGEFEAGQWLANQAPSLLLLATSVNGIDHEKYLTAAAKQQHIPSLALLDYWSNYRLRFQLAGKLQLPSRIALMDERCREEMRQEGFPDDVLLVTGQPVFDSLATKRLDPAIGAALRQQLLPDGDWLLMFVSQPLASLAQLGGKNDGLDERLILQALGHELSALCVATGRRARLLVRLHPREQPVDLEPLPALPGLECRFAPPGDAHAQASTCDLVVGMHSMLLEELCYLGLRVLSYQPGLDPTQDTLPANRAGRSHVVYRREALQAALAQELLDPASRPLAALPVASGPGAVSRLLVEIKELLK